MAAAETSNATCGNGTLPSEHTFQGTYFLIRPKENGQTIKIVYRSEQLLHFLYPAFYAAFRVRGATV